MKDAFNENLRAKTESLRKHVNHATGRMVSGISSKWNLGWSKPKAAPKRGRT